MIKFLIIQCDGDQKGGPTTFLHQFLEHLDRNEFEPSLVFLSPGYAVELFRAKGFKVNVLRAGRLRHLHRTISVVAQLVLIISREKFSIVFSTGGKEHVYGGVAARIARKPAFWLTHNIWDGSVGLATVVRMIPSSLILANSRYAAQTLDHRLRGRAKIVYMGTEVPQIENMLAGAEAFRKGLPVRSGLITTVGMLSRIKGQEYFLRAAPKILGDFPEVKFILVGDVASIPFESSSAYSTQLQRIVKEEGLEDNIIFTGFRRDVMEIMLASDIIVHPSIVPETFSFVLVEAMAVGRPVVASRIGAQRELVVDGETGILVPPGDPQAIAEACIRLLGDAGLREKMGKAGRERVQRCFGVERMVREIEELFLGLTGCKRSKSASPL